jgi:hypothetical protein
VDYALLSRGRPVLLVEAKALDIQPDDYKYVAQVLAYANMTGAEWALLTNGLQWDLYAVLARGDVKNKSIFSKTVDAPDFLDWMGWISPSRVEASELDRFWRLLLAERTVKAKVERLFRERSDSLVKLLADETGLHAGEVATALQALKMSFDGPSMEGRIEILSGMADSQPPEATPKPRRKPAQRPTRSTSSRPTTRHAGPTLTAPTTGRKPGTLNIGDRSWPLETWRDLLVRAVEDLSVRRPDQYDAIFTATELRGRKRAMFSRSPGDLRHALEIPGGFAEAHMSATAIVALVNKLFGWSRLDVPVSYTYRE